MRTSKSGVATELSGRKLPELKEKDTQLLSSKLTRKERKHYAISIFRHLLALVIEVFNLSRESFMNQLSTAGSG